MALIVIPKVRVIAVGQADVECEVARKFPGISPVELPAIVGGHAVRRVEGQQVVADTHGYVVRRRIEEVCLCREQRYRAAKARPVDSDASRFRVCKLSVNGGPLPVDAEAY